MPKRPNKNHNKIVFLRYRNTAKQLARRFRLSESTIYRIWGIGYISNQGIPQGKVGRPKGKNIKGKWFVEENSQDWDKDLLERRAKRLRDEGFETEIIEKEVPAGYYEGRIRGQSKKPFFTLYKRKIF